jgi:uncharacterized phiE125 gp8 family phage protein
VAEHLRIPDDQVPAETSVLSKYIGAAQGLIERLTERQLLTATWEAGYDRFPWWCPWWPAMVDDWPANAVLEIPKPPLKTLTSIKYLDPDGVEQTWASSNYVLHAPQGPQAARARVVPAIGQSWPATANLPNAVRVRFDAGYGTDVNLPAELRQALLLLVGHFYENREAVLVDAEATPVPFAVDALLAPFQRWFA